MPLPLFLAPMLLKLSPVGRALKRITPKQWLIIAAVVLTVFAIWRGIAWHNRTVETARAEGKQEGIEQTNARWQQRFDKQKRKADELALEIRRRTDENARTIAADADRLRLRGAGKAATPAACIPHSAATASGHQPASGNADAPRPEMPAEQWATVPWGWLVRRAEVCDLNRGEVLAWRDWYTRFTAPPPR